MTFLLRIVLTAIGLGISVWLIPGVTITSSASLEQSIGPTPAIAVAFLVIALILGVVNAVVKPIVELVALPVTCLTLGLFGIVINAAMVALTAWLSQFTPFQLGFDNVWVALLTALILMVATAIVDSVASRRRNSNED